MRLLLLTIQINFFSSFKGFMNKILVAGAVTGGTHAQFSANSQRTRFDSDEFDNDFDDLFDRRSRERNSLERDSFERFTFGRTNNNNNNNNVVFRDSLETDSFEIRRPITNNRNANNNFVLVRDSLERDSIEIRRPFGTNLNTNNQRVNNNNNFRSFRRDSPETNSFEIQIPLKNVPLSILNQNLAAPGFRRGSFESVEIRNPFLSAARSNNNNRNNNNNINTNVNNNFGFRRDSDERDNSIEVRIPINNLRSGVTGNTVNNQGSRLGGFRTVSVETDSLEIVNAFGGSRQRQNPSLSAASRPTTRQPAVFFRDSPEDISLEVVLANPFQNTATLSGQQPNRNTVSAPRRPASNFGGRGSVLRFDSFEHNSLERDSLEDLIEDLTDDDADDRARARLALQRLGRLPGGTATPSSLSGAVNNNPFGRPLSATSSRTNPFGRTITTTNTRSNTPARTTNNNANSNTFGLSTNANNANPFGRPLTLNNNNSANTRAVLNQEVTNQLNAIIAANRIPITSSRLSSNNNNNNNFGRPLPTPNTNQASNTRNNNQGSTFSSARFPPLPVSPFTQGLRTNSRINSNTIATTSNFNNNNNNNRFNLNDNRFNLNNNPFLSRTPSNQNQNQQPRSQITAISTTTPRPVRPVTPIPSPSRRPSPPSTPAPTTRRPAPRTTTVRPSPQPQRQSSSSGSSSSSGRGSSFGSGTPNPFETAARLNNIVRSESDKPPANPFINPGPQSKKSGSSSSSSSSSKNKPGSSPRKSIPAVVPMGFEWPGGNGYYFRMSTGNSKPIQYFISYDD